MPRQTYDWSSVDWSKRDNEISREMGVSRERVRQVRPPETKKGRREWVPRAIELYLAGQKIEEISLLVGRGFQSVSRALLDAGIIRRKNYVVDWSTQDWKQTNRSIAENIGCSVGCVELARKRIGAPKSESKVGSNSHLNPDCKALLEAAILSGDASIKQISEDFGIGTGTVYRYAKRLNGPRWESRRNNQ